jgi:hypothetical protein
MLVGIGRDKITVNAFALKLLAGLSAKNIIAHIGTNVMSVARGAKPEPVAM